MSDNRDFDYRKLNDVIHSRIRLAVMTILVSNESAEFNFLKEKIGTTDGNLSSHLSKLEKASYINVEKSFVDKKPMSTYRLTNKGRKAFENYIDMLENFINPT